MTTTETPASKPSVTSVLVSANGRSSASKLPPWMTRQQVADVLFVLDAVLVFAAFILAEQLYDLFVGQPLLSGGNYQLIAGFTALIFYIAARSFRKEPPQIRPSPLAKDLLALSIAFAAVIVLAYGLKQAEIHSRLWFGSSFVMAAALIAAKNWYLKAAFAKGRLGELGVDRIALFGDADIAASLRKSLEAELGNQCRIETYDDQDPSANALGRLINDGLDNKYNRIVFCVRPGQPRGLKELVNAVGYLPVRIEACFSHTELQDLKSAFLVPRDHVLISIDDHPMDEWGAFLKRVVDLSIGSVLLVLALPILAVAAIAIKLDSKGPVFFHQRRHGWNHSIIWVWKLRTMTVQEDGDKVMQAVKNDSRITRVGAFLRKTSLDEVPQIINVLRGEMSLVGPRPHALAHNLHYSELIDIYAARHKVKPGITGWAQVKGLRGNSEEIGVMIERAEADIWYIHNWSLWLDLKIILMTPFVVLFHKNAY